MADQHKAPGEPPAPDPDAGSPSSDAGADDEFRGLEPYRPHRSPVLAVAVILICGYLLFYLRHDLAYALRGRTPTTIADVRGYFREPSRIPDHSYVSVRAVPDRASAIMLDVKGQDEFVPFMRIVGTDARLLLAQRRGLRPLGDVYDDAYAGRLMRLSDVSYAATVREYYAKKVTATRFFKVEDVRALLDRRAAGAAPAPLRDLAGDTIALGDPGRLVGIDVSYPGDYDVILPRDRFPAEADARNVLERLGVEVKDARATRTEHLFTVHLEDARRDAVISEVGSLDPRAQVRLRQRSYRVPWTGLTTSDLGLVLPASAAEPGVTVPWAAVTSVTTVEPLTIPADAFVLVEGERPQDLWYVPVLALCFVLFVVWNLLALWAARRGRERPRPAPV